MSTQRKKSLFWRFVYRFYPPLLRVLEKIRIHGFRQNFLIGHLAPGCTVDRVEKRLIAEGYEIVLLAWRDPGEVLSMRKLDRKIYQYHVRVFEDREIRVHYEFSSEGNPLGHVMESCFEARTEYFTTLLAELLTPLAKAPPIKA